MVSQKSRANLSKGRARVTSKEDDRRIVRLYTKDMWPIRRIASYMNVSYTTVHARLLEAKVKFRSRGNPANIVALNEDRRRAKL